MAVRLAHIGIGYWGQNLLRTTWALPDADVVRACDLRPAVRERAAQHYPSLALTADVEALWRDADVDAVVIATETPTHFALAEAALRAGKHVFVEKPLTTTVAEAERLVALAEAQGRVLMVGHIFRHHPAFQYVEGLIRAGELGDVRYCYSTRVNLGIVRSTENAFESLAPHDLSIVLAFIDSPPVSIQATGQAFLQPGLEDVVFATVHFANGALAHLHVSWLDPHKRREVTVVGSRAMAVIDDMAASEKVRLYDKGVGPLDAERGYPAYPDLLKLRIGDIRLPKIDSTEPLRVEMQHFLECIRTGASPLTDGRNGLAVVRLLEAGQRSLRQGGTREIL